MKHKDKIPGGLADKKKPSDFNPKSLKAGMKIESEHTSNKAIAKEISMDHLTEDSKYYKKLKTIEKKDLIEVTTDGKREPVPGKEPLKKDPKNRWDTLKKALNHATAIMDVEEAMGDGDDAEQPAEQPEGQPAEQPEGQPAEQPEGQPAEQPEGQPAEQPEGQPAEQPEAIEQRIIQALKDDGHSDAEIAYIVHGQHSPQTSETDAAKAKATTDMADLDVGHASRQADMEHAHAQRMNEIEHKRASNEVTDPAVEKDHRQRMLDAEYETTQQKTGHAKLELEHKKRMLDLEYQQAQSEAAKVDPSEASKQRQLEFEMDMKRKEKELDLEFKKKELQLKLKITEESAKQKAEHAGIQAEEDAKTNAAVKKEQAKHKVASAKLPPEPKKEAK